MWHAIRRDGGNIGRDQIYGLMRLADIPGAYRGRKPITTRAAKIGEEVCPEGLRVLFLNVGKSCCFPLADLGIPIVGELAEFFDAGLAVQGIRRTHMSGVSEQCYLLYSV